MEMEKKVLGLFRLLSPEERNEIVDELAVSLEDFYDAFDNALECVHGLEESINRICYGDSATETDTLMQARWERLTKFVQRELGKGKEPQ